MASLGCCHSEMVHVSAIHYIAIHAVLTFVLIGRDPFGLSRVRNNDCQGAKNGSITASAPSAEVSTIDLLTSEASTGQMLSLGWLVQQTLKVRPAAHMSVSIVR